MARYHISRAGTPAVCKAASDAACPLSGQHFPSRDTAAFYAETLATAVPTATFPETNHDWRLQQMLTYWADDQQINYDHNPYVREGATPEEALEERVMDYESGFMTTLHHPLYNRSEVYARAAADLGADPIDRATWLQGHRRATQLLAASPDDFVTDLIDDPAYGEGKYAHMRFLANPFARGETAIIPAGSHRVADGANEPGVLRKTKLAPGTYKIIATEEAHVSTGSGQTHIRPATVTLAGKSRHYLVPVTPAIIAANELRLIETEPGNAHLVHPERHHQY